MFGFGLSWLLDWASSGPGMGVFLKGSPLSMMFIVALYLSWCRHLGAQTGVQPQLYADNLKCVSRDPEVLLRAARFTTGYVRLVCQEPAPSKCVLMSTSRAVRSAMRGWVVSDDGHRWSVKLDVRDLGGHLDTTFHGWSSTLASRVRLVFSRLVLVFALPLDFHGRLRVLRSMFIPGALHGIEASFLAGTSMRKVRAAILGVAWSRRQPFANVGVVLSLLDGPSGCDPAFCVVWFRFRMLRRYLAYRPGEVSSVYRLLESAAEGSPGHGPVHLLLQSAAVIGFRWDPEELAWDRPGLPLLSNLSGPFQHFRAAILGAWRDKVSADLCARKGFRGGPSLDIDGTLQLLNSDHVRERDKALLRSILVGGVWNGFLLGKIQGQDVPCRFCGGRDPDGHLFWDCTFPPLVEIREHPEFHALMEMDKTSWPRCLLRHGWLPLLSGVNGGSLLRELLVFLSVLLGGILPVSFMLRVRLEGLLRNLMFGLMVVWLMTRCLVFLLRGLGALFIGLVGFGLVGGGVIGTMMLVMVLLFLLVVVSAQFLGLCRLFKGLNFGVLFLRFRLVMVFILEVIIWELFVI